MQLWILASENDGKIPNDIEEIKFRLRTTSIKQKDVNVFIDKGLLIGCKHLQASAVPETEGEKRQSREETETTGNNKKFTKPSADEVVKYAKSIDYSLDGNKFVDYYESKGWMIGKNKMRSWKAAVRTWKRNNKTEPKVKTPGNYIR